MTPRTSLSALGLTALCPGSASLPRVEHVSPAQAFGHAVHEMIADHINNGLGARVDMMPHSAVAHGLTDAQAQDLALLARSLRLPIPAGALAEVPLGWFADGSVRRVEGGRGEYEDAPGLLLAGTLDVMWAEPNGIMVLHNEGRGGRMTPDESAVIVDYNAVLWVVDFKVPSARMQDEDGGSLSVTPLARNWQLRAGALLAARWTGATRVIVAICYVSPEGAHEARRKGETYQGTWELQYDPPDARGDVRPHVIGEDELQQIERDVRAVLAAAGIGGNHAERVVVDERKGLGRSPGGMAETQGVGGGARGGLPRESGFTRTNAQYQGPRLITGAHCAHCDRAAACPAWGGLVRGALSDGGRSDVLALTERPHVHAAMLAARRFADAAELVLRAGGPVELGGGREYSAALEEVRELDAGKVLDVLAEEVGDEHALLAAEVSYASIKRAVPDAATRKRVWERLDAMGAVEVSHRERWRVRHVAEVRDADGEVFPDGDRRERLGRGEGRPEARGGEVLRDEGLRGGRVRDLDPAGRVIGDGARGRSEARGGERGEHGPERRAGVLSDASPDDRGSLRGADAGRGGAAGPDDAPVPGPAADGGQASGAPPDGDDRAADGDGHRERDGAAAGEHGAPAVPVQRFHGASEVPSAPEGAALHVPADGPAADGGPGLQGARSPYVRGICAHCGAEVAVNANGKPRKHPDKRPTGHGSYCGGHTIAALPIPSQATIPGA